MAKILRAVALVSIIALSMTAAMVVVGTLGAIIIAPSAHNNQAGLFNPRSDRSSHSKNDRRNSKND